MKEFDFSLLKQLYTPPLNSHKGQNGKLLIIGGSKLFHAASLWALQVASRIVDMVYYASVPENNRIVLEAKKEFRNGIVIRRDQIDSYTEEADCVLIGPGLPRAEGKEEGDDDTRELTERLLTQYAQKRWVIDGGSLQVMEPNSLLQLKEVPIVTPHKKEFQTLFKIKDQKLIPPWRDKNTNQNSEIEKELVAQTAAKYNCIILLKGLEDLVCSSSECMLVKGGNAGMTKGGTGDVLAGLVAALYCKNDAFLSAICGSYINKKAGDELFKRVGYYFNASDLANEIPRVMKGLIPN